MHKQQRFDDAEKVYNRVLNTAHEEPQLLFLMSDLYMRKDYNGLAIHLLTNVLRMKPDFSEAWCNLGIAYRKEHLNDHAKAAWDRALEIAGDTAEVCNNMAGLYADMAEPQLAMEWTERALKVDPKNVYARWNKALAYLTAGNFEEGWKLYESRQFKEGWHARDRIECPLWDGKKVKSLYIHGEQGVGDEIMFASAIPHVLDLADEITLEVHPKVAGLCKQTWPQFNVVTSEVGLAQKFDAKIPIGSLIGRFGLNPKPYLEPHPEKVAHYRRELEKLGPGPYVAITWIGGTKETRSHTRSMGLNEFAPILNRYTCVSAQYSPEGAFEHFERERIKNGLAKINEASCGENLHDQAALFKAVDAVVTVQQTAVHVAGAVGAKTYALIGTNPHWRYGVGIDRMPFYSDVRLIRKKTDWAETVERALQALEADL